LLEYWCAWQNSNQIDDLNAFLAELSRQNRLLPEDLSRWERAVDKALSQTLCAEVGVVLACLGRPAGVQQPSGSGQLATDKAPATDVPPAAESTETESGSGAFTSHSQQVVQSIMDNWPQLPEQASFADFWAQVEPVLTFFGWPQRQEPLLERAR